MLAVKTLVSWVVPDLALTLSVTVVLILFFGCDGATALFNDSDTGWHIRAGEQIIETGVLPKADPFSFSKPGEAWIAWEWGSDVLMSHIHGFGGLAGVALMFGLTIGVSVWMWFRLHQAAGGNFLLACLFFVPVLPIMSLHWLARPHLFSWLFLAGTVWMCEKMPKRPGWAYFAFAAALAATWTNLHASFFFGPLIALIYAVGEYLKPLLWAVPESKAPQGRQYISLALAAAAGTFANPHGWRLHQHVLSYLFDTALTDHISEFQSFNFHEDGALRIMLMLALCFAGAMASLADRRPERFLLAMLLMALALHSERALPVAALLLLPLANGSITAVLRRAAGLTASVRSGIDHLLGYGDRLRALEHNFRGFALVPLLAILIFSIIRGRAGFSAERFPVAASIALARLPPSARIFAPDTFGGYLIYRFNGERKVFVDGRSDFYGAEFGTRYARILEVQPGWQAVFNRWNFTNALLPPDYPLLAALKEAGWKELYRDGTAVLMAGKSPL